ncbi:MAG: flagellar type III secretion system pore protein FliP [Nitrospirota bacterium]
MNGLLKIALISFIMLIIIGITDSITYAQGGNFTIPKVTIGIDNAENNKDIATTIQIVILLTILSLAPAILVMLTSFTRIVVVLSFMRQALGTQQVPPNQVLVSLALFLTFFIMTPVWKQINDEAFQPFLKKDISQELAFNKAIMPLRKFMFAQTSENDLSLFLDISRAEKRPEDVSDIPTSVVIPAFIISELKTAFQIGFLIYIPFLVLDMVIASVLMSMGMLMLPPIIISLPFKLMLFVLIDGWHLIIGSLVKSFSV